MSTRINRIEFMQALESVTPGLTPKAVQEQSNCFVFMDGHVKTYNEEIACSHPTKLPANLKCAVRAKELLILIQKLPEDEIDVSYVDGEFRINGKRKSAGLVCDAEIHLPVDMVEPPSSWKKLDPEFSEAVDIVQHCAGKDIEKNYIFACVHIHPSWLEACDNVQMVRYNLETPIGKSALVRRDTLQHIVTLGMVKVSETDNWIHFKNPHGLTFSCRRYMEASYRDLTPLFAEKLKGAKPIAFPKGLSEAVEKAEIFSAENAEKSQNKVTVELSPGKLKIRGQGINGWYTETKKVTWQGQPMTFTINPKLLAELVKKHNECLITKERLKVDGGKFLYLSCLGVIEDGKESEAA